MQIIAFLFIYLSDICLLGLTHAVSILFIGNTLLPNLSIGNTLVQFILS